MAIKINSKFFTQANRVFSGRAEDGLTAAMRAVLQAQAKIAASAVTDITDNSGGAAADGTIPAIADFTPAVLGSTDAVQKAELEASFAALTDALKELIAHANALHAKVPAMDGTLVDSITGTAVDGTIAAIDASMTAVATSLASATGANAFVESFRNAVSKLAYHVNKLAVACGEAALVDNSGGDAAFGLTFANISEDTGTAVSGADTTAANAAIKKTDADAKLAVMAGVIKEFATKLNALGNATGGVMGAVAA